MDNLSALIIRLTEEGEIGQALSYLVDLGEYKFDDTEETPTTWLQAFPYGKYQHPIHGEIDMTPEKAQRMASNIKLNVRGQDLDIDYDHKALTTEAAGWVKDAEARQDGLWIAVNWTKSAYMKLKERAFRYFSPEYTDKWTHPATKQVHQDVMFGGALTNRPFLKGILPINLSEVIQANEGGNLVDRATMEKLAKRLGVQFDANTSDEALAAALSAVPETDPNAGGEGNQGGTGEGEGEGTGEGASEGAPAEGTPEAIAASELKKLAETNPLVKAMLAERADTQKRLAELEKSNQLSEVNLQLSEVQTAANKKGFAIPPVVIDNARKMATDPKTKPGDVVKLLSDVVNAGLIELGERGSTGEGGAGGGSTDAGKTFNDKVTALTKDGKMSYADAAEQVAIADPELYTQYLNEMMTGVQL